MATMIDTLHYADTFADAGLEPRAAKALAHAFAEANAVTREELVTKDFLDYRLLELEGRINIKLGEVDRKLAAIGVKVTDVKVDVIRWLLASQVLLIALLAALANFTKLFSH